MAYFGKTAETDRKIENKDAGRSDATSGELLSITDIPTQKEPKKGLTEHFLAGAVKGCKGWYMKMKVKGE